MKYFFTTVFIMLSVTFVLAQSYNGGATNYNHFMNSDYQRTNVVEKNLITLFEKWDNSNVIILTDGSKFSLKNVNIDLKQNRFVFKDKDVVFFYDFDNLDFMKINNKAFKVVNINNVNQIVQVLHKGIKNSFYKGQSIVFKEAIKDPMMINASSKNYYKRDNYFISKNELVYKIKLKRKSILSILSDKEKEIALFVKQNKLSYRKSTDIVKILNYYNKI